MYDTNPQGIAYARNSDCALTVYVASPGVVVFQFYRYDVTPGDAFTVTDAKGFILGQSGSTFSTTMPHFAFSLTTKTPGLFKNTGVRISAWFYPNGTAVPATESAVPSSSAVLTGAATTSSIATSTIIVPSSSAVSTMTAMGSSSANAVMTATATAGTMQPFSTATATASVVPTLTFILNIAMLSDGSPLSNASFSEDVASALLVGVAATLGVKTSELVIASVKTSVSRQLADLGALGLGKRGLAAGGLDIAMGVQLLAAHNSALLSLPVGASDTILTSLVNAAISEGISSGLLTDALASSPAALAALGMTAAQLRSALSLKVNGKSVLVGGALAGTSTASSIGGVASGTFFAGILFTALMAYAYYYLKVQKNKNKVAPMEGNAEQTSPIGAVSPRFSDPSTTVIDEEEAATSVNERKANAAVVPVRHPLDSGNIEEDVKGTTEATILQHQHQQQQQKGLNFNIDEIANLKDKLVDVTSARIAAEKIAAENAASLEAAIRSHDDKIIFERKAAADAATQNAAAALDAAIKSHDDKMIVERRAAAQAASENAAALDAALRARDAAISAEHRATSKSSLELYRAHEHAATIKANAEEEVQVKNKLIDNLRSMLSTTQESSNERDLSSPSSGSLGSQYQKQTALKFVNNDASLKHLEEARGIYGQEARFGPAAAARSTDAGRAGRGNFARMAGQQTISPPNNPNAQRLRM